jgi:hypothetical protein
LQTKPASPTSRCVGQYTTRNEDWLPSISAAASSSSGSRLGHGKSGGFRTLIVFRAGARAIFVHGFAKNEKDNIERDEVAALKKLAAELLAYDDKTIARVVASGVLVEVTCDEKTIP